MKEASIHYLIEIRKRLLLSLAVLGGIFLVFAFYANRLYHFLALPMLDHLAEGQHLIAITVPAPFLVPFKSAFVLALFLSIPFLLYQLWSFIAPALYQEERNLLWGLLLTSSLLFYLGSSFAYFVVLPLIFHFFIHIAPLGVKVTPDINHYFSFVMRILIAFGVAFEIPIAILILLWSGICTRATLVRKRPYIIVGSFILGMLLTPPDVLSQILLALPIWGLFELGLFVSSLIIREEENE